MNPLKALCVVAFLAAAVCANQQYQQQTLKLKPTQWLSPSQLKQTPSADEISVERLENMSLEEGAKALQTMYHVSRIDYDLKPSFVPSPNNIPVTIVKSNGQKVSTTLDKLATTANQIPNFGQQEVTIFITGLPSKSETVQEGNQQLVQAYVERYSYLSSKSKTESPVGGNLVIIDLGNQLSSSKRYTMLNVPETGVMIAEQIIQMVEKCKVPSEILHIVAQNIAAHVAGAAGKEFQRQTGGKQFSRITALDPSKVYAQDPECVTGLSRGDAELVDAIHTSAWGMGTTVRVGNVDFFPNGLSIGVPGSSNVIDATMRATKYFAETVRPGNQYNFPAVESNSLESYKSRSVCGKRVYMGLALAKGSEGDYILQVNEHSPYGQKTPAQEQKNCRTSHKTSNWTSD